ELFHEVSVRVPLIIYDPRKEADATRGTATNAFVEAIDLVPTFLGATGAPSANHRLEGRSLEPLLHGQTVADWRDAVFSEIDYAFYAARETLGVGVSDARGYMLRTERWKYVHFRHFPPQLFDLDNDPNEFNDLGRDPDHEATRHSLHARLLDRLTARKNRVTMTDDTVHAMRGDEDSAGIIIGKWSA
ncbi:MAG: sulfatase/phosphatase domain-containing protein, partial [Geminicoccaceae bacterium]